jgi:hypothetical protein
MHNVRIVEGTLMLLYTERVDLTNVSIYTSGGAGTDSDPTEIPLIYVYKTHKSLAINNCRLVRDTGTKAGPLLLVQHGTASEVCSRLAVNGGEWFTAVDPGAESAYVSVFSASHPTFRGLRLRIEDPAPTGESAFKLRPTVSDIIGPSFIDVTIESPNGKVDRGIGFYALDGNDITEITVEGLKAPGAVTTGVLYDLNSGGAIDTAPIMQNCNFTGTTNAWKTDHSATGTVFPIVAGNKGGVCSMVGTVAPEGVVTAMQGSTYIHQNGNSTALYFKSTGTGNTGWTALAVP